MPISTVLFDLDDTLIVDEAVSREAFADVAGLAAERYGIPAADFRLRAATEARALWAKGPANAYCRAIGISAFECLWGRFEGDGGDLRVLREWSRVYRVAAFDAAVRSFGIEDGEAGAVLAERFERARRTLQRLMPDAREVLARLAVDYRIGLLTNGAPDLQREKILASGLGGHFRVIAVSGEHGIGKPDPALFHRVLAEIGGTPAESAMVGNSLERDIAGARAAGILSIWLQVPGSEETDPVEPDRTIRSLSELPSLLRDIP